MPGHQKHDLIGLMTAPAVAGLAWQVSGDAGAGLVVGASHIAGTIWLSPDLDLDTAIDDRWGVFGLLWMPYQRLIPHRSWLSHSGMSALLRVAYLGAVVSVVLALASALVGWDFWSVVGDVGGWLADHGSLVAWMLAGLVTADAVHVAADLLSTWIKRRV